MLIDIKDQIIKDLGRRLAFMNIKHNYPKGRHVQDAIIIRALMEELLMHTGKKIVAYQPLMDEVNISSLRLPSISSDINTSIAMDIDVLVVPMLGYHPRGYRLGRGGGFYDKLLAAKPGLITIGLAYEEAEIPFIPSAFDIPLQMIITESNVHTFENGVRRDLPHSIYIEGV